jgi:hypothetical protein
VSVEAFVAEANLPEVVLRKLMLAHEHAAELLQILKARERFTIRAHANHGQRVEGRVEVANALTLYALQFSDECAPQSAR